MISIIGAGPAGNYTAYLLTTKGQDVTVYEDGHRIGFPVQCSGVVTQAIDELIKIKKQLVINKIKKIRFFPDKKNLEINIKPDYVLNRGEFDRYLADKAEKAGAKFKLNHRFISYGHINKDELKLKFADGKTINTNLLIGADGPYSKVAQSANLFVDRKFIVGIQARCKTKIEDKSRADIFLGYGEFGWLIPEDEYTARIGLVSETNPKADFHKLLKQLNAEIITHHSGLIPLYNPKNKTQTDKVYLVGDAAAQIKASTHGGILFSLIASQQLTKAITKNQDYEKLWKEKIGKELWLHLKIRNALCRFSNENYSDLIGYFSQEKLRTILSENLRDYPSKFLFKALLKEPRLLKFITKAI